MVIELYKINDSCCPRALKDDGARCAFFARFEFIRWGLQGKILPTLPGGQVMLKDGSLFPKELVLEKRRQTCLVSLASIIFFKMSSTRKVVARGVFVRGPLDAGCTDVKCIQAVMVAVC